MHSFSSQLTSSAWLLILLLLLLIFQKELVRLLGSLLLTVDLVFQVLRLIETVEQHLPVFELLCVVFRLI
jgi:hypothetical protein